MKNVIKNKNLFVAERLLEIITQKTGVVFVNDSLSLEKEFIPELSNEELVESLKRLEEREVIKFEDEEDKLDTKNIKYIDLSFNKEKLLEFIKIAKNKVFGTTTQYKKDLEYVLEALDLLLRPKFLNKQVEFSEIGNEYIEITEWIADYSGIIKVIYELEADAEWKNTKRPHFIGVSEQPKKLEILDRPILEQLNNEIRQFAIKPYQKRISLFLDKNPETEWRCANCGRFFEKITDKKQITNYLNDFSIYKFKICYKCRKRNYFSISTTRKMKFLLAKPRQNEKIPKSIKSLFRSKEANQK